jgi:hypothetical protein
MLRTLRWISFLPLAFLASLIASAIGTFAAELLGGGSWYIWSTSGALAAYAFFNVAFRVAPARTAFVKWSAVTVVGALGLISAAGSLTVPSQRIRALTGALMVVFAIVFARMPVDSITSDLGQASEPAAG